MRLIRLSDLETAKLIEADRAEIVEAEHLTSDRKVRVKPNIGMASRRKIVRCIKIMLAISFLGTVFVLIRVHFMQADDGSGLFHLSSLFVPRIYKIDDVVKLKLEDRSLAFKDSATGHFITINFAGDVVNKVPDLDSCLKILGTADADHATQLKLGLDPFSMTLCLKWKDTVLVVNDTHSKRSRCFSVKWTTQESSTPENCVSMSGAHWYGGSLFREQQWPLEDVSIPMQPYISSQHTVFQNQDSHGDYGPVLERMWMSSAGFGIIADSKEPLHVSVNDHHKAWLCLKTQEYGGEKLKRNSSLTLTYNVCLDRPARYVHEHLVKKFLQLPKEAPSERLMLEPLWSTRGINVHNLTQKQALDLKINITSYHFPHSQLHIAGNISRKVGELFFDHERFPNAHQMVGEMKFEGFSVSTSILPLMERDAFDFKEGVKVGAFVNAANTSKDLFVGWENKTLSLIDFTNPEVCQWMAKNLRSFKAESSIAGFRFESGEATLLPTPPPPTSTPLPNPCDYSRHLVKFASSLGNDSVVSVGYQSQEFPVMVDIGARRSSWDHNMGLKSIIPSVLTVGLLGYPFVVVGPVGGVVADKFNLQENRLALPDKELYIRWLQLSIFLPSFEMSVGPWEYSKEMVEVARDLLRLRAEKVVPVLQTAVREFLHNGAPIIRPLWWMAPDDEHAQRIDCEFLISNKLLVAPVFSQGARSRDVYLPKVKDLRWKDVTKGTVYPGGQWLRGFPVDISEVAVFTPVLRSQSE